MFCDSAGNPKIDAQFDYAEPFSSGFAIVGNKNKKGVIDVDGNIIVPLKFRTVVCKSFYNEANKDNNYDYCFSVNDDSVAYTREGKVLQEVPEELILSSLEEMDDYYRVFENYGKYGFIEGYDTVIPAIYSYLDKPTEGYSILIASNDGSSYGILTAENEILKPFEYSTITWDDDNGIFVLEKENEPGRCFMVFDGYTAQNPVCCGYKRVIRNYFDYFLVENLDGIIYYVDASTGRELRR
jgi:hypothetical protein